MRLVVDPVFSNEDYVSGMIRVYGDICKIIDNYINGIFYETSYEHIKKVRFRKED